MNTFFNKKNNLISNFLLNFVNSYANQTEKNPKYSKIDSIDTLKLN